MLTNKRLLRRAAIWYIVPCVAILAQVPSVAAACEGAGEEKPVIEITPAEPGLVPITPNTLTVTIKNNYNEEGEVRRNTIRTGPFTGTTNCGRMLASLRTCEDFISANAGARSGERGELEFSLLVQRPITFEFIQPYRLLVR